MGVLTTFLIQFFSSKGKMQGDAAMGTVFTFLFAVGVILVTKYAGQADIDADCVLHGELAFVPLQQTTLFGFAHRVLYGHCLCYSFLPKRFGLATRVGSHQFQSEYAKAWV